MDYLFSEPIPLPEDLAERKKVLTPYAEDIAHWYGDSFDPTNPHRQLTTALHANYLIEARVADELKGIFAYGIISPENPSDKPFYDNLDLEKLPPDLYPVPISEDARGNINKAIQSIKEEFTILEIQEQVVDKAYRRNGLSNTFKEIAFATKPKGKRILLGDFETGPAIIQQTKKEIGGVTYFGGRRLEPHRNIPFGLTEDEFKILGQVIAHAYALKHYPGVPMDRNGILDSDVWDKETKMPDFKYAVNNPDPSLNNQAVPEIKVALQKLIDYQQQNPGHFYSGIAVTIVDNPAQNVITLPQLAQIKAA